MKKHVILSLFFTIILFALSGCTISSKGNSLHGFTQRMNAFPEKYSLTQAGYISDKSENTLTRFFAFNSEKIMLQFECGNELTSLHIVFDKNCINNSQALKFVKNSIEAYTESPEITNELLNKIDFNNAINTTSYETKKAKIGDIELLLDTTEKGIVITVNRNMQ